MHVDAGREQPGLFRKPRQADDLPHALGGVAGADQNPGGRRQAFPGIPDEAPGVRPHRVLERGAVDLDGVRDRAAERPGQDHRAHHHVVGQRDVGADGGHHVADRADVRRDVPFDLGVGQQRVRAGIKSRVVIGHVDRQGAADVGQVHGAADGLAQALDLEFPVLPAPDRVHEVVLGGTLLLAEQVDLVAEVNERPGQLRVVDVASRAAQEVAVKNKDSQAITSPAECACR